MSRLERLGLSPDPAAAADLLERAGRFETIRLVFPDLHGVLHGKAVPAARLPAILEGGLGAPATLLLKDTSGRTAFPVWDPPGPRNPSPMQGVGDLVMVPDPEGLVPVPGASEAWLFCDVARADGAPIPFAPTTMLRQALDALAAEGLSLTVGLELEFHVFARGGGGMEAVHPGGQLLHDGTHATARPILDALRRGCAAAGLPLASLEVEMGASQFEATFEPGPAWEQARLAAVFRAVAREALPGHHVTFMCRPPAPATMASGWHLHQSLRAGGGPLPGDDPRHAHWIAGLLAHAAGACLLTNPTVNAYRRFAPGAMAPDRVCWGRDNRGAMLRALPGRVENRCPEPGANPWLAMAAQAICGLAGLRAGAAPPAPVEAPYAAECPRLPESLGAAVEAFEADPPWEAALGAEACRVLATVARASWRRYLAEVGAWDAREYMDLL